MKTPRTLTVHHRRIDDRRQTVGVVVREGRKLDIYGVTHAAGSCEVRWVHEDGGRDYVVTCSASDAAPIRCTCPAGRWYAGECRHRAGTRALTSNGYLTFDVLTDAGHDRGCTE